MDAETAVRRALDTVGCLTAAQAARLTGEAPSRAVRRLEAWVRAGTALRYRDAFWHPGVGRRAAAHRLMVADLYVGLAALDPDWRLDPGGVEPYRPDLWIVEVSGPRRVAVEADRGTEREPAWADKVARMRGAAVDGVLVVAASPAIHRRIRRQMADRWPCPAYVTDLANLHVEAVRAWLSALPLPAPPPSVSARPTRRYELCRGDAVLPIEGPIGIPPGSGVERLAGVDRIYEPIDKGPQLTRCLGRIRRFGRGR
jgi:hypothetical protein